MFARMRYMEQGPLVRDLVCLLGLCLLAVPLLCIRSDGTATVAAAEVTVWSIGTLDDSNGEFAGTVGAFTVGTDPDSAFPPKLSGGGTVQTILFDLATVSGPYYVYVSAKDTAQNSTSGMEATINGVKLTPRWAGSWEFKKWGNGGRNQGVQTLRWALPTSALVAGANTLELRVSAAPNAGPGSAPDGVTPYFDVDYVALMEGSLNLAQPKRWLGSTSYWIDDSIRARNYINGTFNGGSGCDWISYLLEQNTLDSDVEIVEEMRWTAAYPDLDWNDVHIGTGQWDEDVWDYYYYTFEQLREAGVERNLVKLQYTPHFCSSAPTEDNYDRYPPTSDDCWTEFIQETAERLGDIVDDYAIMNEVNMGGFWQGTMEEYWHLEILAYDIIKQYDTIDADGDGIAAIVSPSSSNEPTQTSLWQDHYAAMCPRSPEPDDCWMDTFHTHDYKWGIKPGADDIQAIDPSLGYIISETGPANWFIDQGAVPMYNPAAMASVIGYVMLDPTSTVDFVTQWLLKGDPDKDAPWPNDVDWCNSEPDPYANNDGYYEDFNSSLINIEPPGPPYTNWKFTSAGAYLQHWGWVFATDGVQVPVEMVGNGDWQYEVDAIDLGSSIEVIVTNFEGGMLDAPHTITMRLTTPWSSVKVDTYDPDDFNSTTTVSGPVVTLTATDLSLDSMRYVLSDASAPADAEPGVFIAAPSKSATVAGNVSITADAYDDGTIASVEYRVDPIDEGAFTSMAAQGGSSYAATWDSTTVADGDHAIQVKVTDNTGNSSTVSHVVVVDNVGAMMHVGNIAMSSQKQGPFYKALATVTILDEGDVPVEGATVHGAFSGASADSVSGATGPDGTVTMSSSKVRDGGAWEFCVTDVVKDGWTYDPDVNVETCDSIIVP
jgi:hypothetical protein